MGRVKMIDEIDMKIIEKITRDAGDIIINIYNQNFEIKYKDDNSPLTEADLKSNEFICSELLKYYPSIPILSEENKLVPYNERKLWEYYWCIDPIDGTKEFIKKNGEFTINIALINIDKPCLGVVYAPILNKMYSAKKGEGAFLNNLQLPLAEYLNKTFTVVASRSHLTKNTENFIEELKSFYPDLEISSKGSSLKICMIAEGSASIYPRMAPTMEWDTAAADAIVREAGGMIYQYNASNMAIDYIKNKNKFEILKYNKKCLINDFFVVVKF